MHHLKCSYELKGNRHHLNLKTSSTCSVLIALHSSTHTRLQCPPRYAASRFKPFGRSTSGQPFVCASGPVLNRGTHVINQPTQDWTPSRYPSPIVGLQGRLEGPTHSLKLRHCSLNGSIALPAHSIKSILGSLASSSLRSATASLHICLQHCILQAQKTQQLGNNNHWTFAICNPFAWHIH